MAPGTGDKCPDCKGTGIDNLRSSPFVKKECDTCRGTGSIFPPVYYYVCDICDKSLERDASAPQAISERACHKCMLIVCPSCQTIKEDKQFCPRCGTELSEPVF